MYNVQAINNPDIPMIMRNAVEHVALTFVNAVIAHGADSYEATDAHRRMVALCNEVAEYCDKNGIRKG